MREEAAGRASERPQEPPPESPAAGPPAASGPSRVGWLAGLLALGALTLHLAAGAWGAATRSGKWLAEGFRHRGEGYEESRRRLFGEYAQGLEQAEQWIQPSADYVLMTTVEGGLFLILQGDLAPRRAVYDGQHGWGLPGQWRRRGIPSHAPWGMVHFHSLDRRPTIAPLLEHPQAWPRPPEE